MRWTEFLLLIFIDGFVADENFIVPVRFVDEIDRLLRGDWPYIDRIVRCKPFTPHSRHGSRPLPYHHLVSNQSHVMWRSGIHPWLQHPFSSQKLLNLIRNWVAATNGRLYKISNVQTKFFFTKRKWFFSRFHLICICDKYE